MFFDSLERKINIFSKLKKNRYFSFFFSNMTTDSEKYLDITPLCNLLDGQTDHDPNWKEETQKTRAATLFLAINRMIAGSQETHVFCSSRHIKTIYKFVCMIPGMKDSNKFNIEHDKEFNHKMTSLSMGSGLGCSISELQEARYPKIFTQGDGIQYAASEIARMFPTWKIDDFDDYYEGPPFDRDGAQKALDELVSPGAFRMSGDSMDPIDTAISYCKKIFETFAQIREIDQTARAARSDAFVAFRKDRKEKYQPSDFGAFQEQRNAKRAKK